MHVFDYVGSLLPNLSANGSLDQLQSLQRWPALSSEGVSCLFEDAPLLFGFLGWCQGSPGHRLMVTWGWPCSRARRGYPL